MRARVLTALVAIPVVLGAIFFTHPLPFLAIEILVFALATTEYFRMVEEARVFPIALCALLFSVLSFVWTSMAQGTLALVVLLVAQCCAIASISLRMQKPPRQNVYLTLCEALGWIGAPLIALALLRPTMPGSSWQWTSILLLVLIPIWAGDIAGILIGMKWGSHKLAPSISPKKSIEGAIANFVCSIAAGAIVAWQLGLLTWVGIVCGLLASVLGQSGDLFESFIKRRVDVKDSGTLLPGHGGLLDRIDSLLFASIPTALFLVLFAH